MNVDCSNFTAVLPKVIEEIQKCNFIAIDIEFSGLFCNADCTPSLFDSLEERYVKLRNNVSSFIPVQLGISLFTKSEGKNEFKVNTYSFYCCPRFYGPPISCFSLETGAIEFLADNSFDFNKFARYGIPFLNKPQEETFRKFMKEKFISFDLSYSMIDRLIDIRKQIKEWMILLPVRDGCRHGENTFPYQPFTNPLINYLLIDHLRKEYKNFWITQQGDKLFIKTVSHAERKQLMSSIEKEENDVIDSCIGLTKLVNVIIESGKPIVGNNMMVDLTMLYHHFIEPMPVNLQHFKKEILKNFPVIYDVKSIIFNVKKYFPAYEDSLSARNLEDLYEKLSKPSFTSSSKFQSTIIRDDSKDCDNGNHYHDAGFDAYITGYVFLRVCALIAEYESDKCILEPVVEWESLIRPITPFKNKINLIRAAYHFMDLEAKSQKAVRPEWLVLRCRDKSTSISIAQIYNTFSSASTTIDFKQISKSEIVLAVGNFRTARDLIEKYRKDKNYMITRYNFIRDSTAGRLLLWTTLIIGAGSTGYLVHKVMSKYL
ncbi:pre-piRNA 3'-exonuclease trimmer [Tetranychus urticae]|uniref:Uncharacterized protein n=1 Tax=Tetranychus urticae TaxID=32264 RepID=T1KR32_TETUR|nr:pre-piRNA 3'-exonuclease trimmer [Tetranychus urticae]